MSRGSLKDSDDPWKYMVVIGKIVLQIIDSGIAKSFGLLLPELVVRFNSDFKTIAFICSLHPMMCITAPIGNILLQVMTQRKLAMVGGLLSAVPLMCVPFASSIHALGTMMSIAGFGIAMMLFLSSVSINEYFPESYIFMNIVTLFGRTGGAFAIPVIVERSLEAYGFHGAFLILGGICLHTVVTGAVLRPPRAHPGPSFKDENFRKIKSRSQDESYRTTDRLLERESKSREGTRAKVLNGDCPVVSKDDDFPCADRDDQPLALKAFFQSLSTIQSQLSSFILVTEPMCTLVSPAIFLTTYYMYAWMLFLVPHAEGQGIDRSDAVFLSTIAGLSGIVGRIFFLALIRFKVDFALIFSFSCLMCAATFFMDTLCSTYLFLAIMASLQGFFIFIIDCLPTTMIKLAVRNEENMPKEISIALFLEAAGAVAGDTLSGHIYDVTSSYSMVFISLGGVLVAMSINLLIFFIVVRYYAPMDKFVSQ